MTLRLLRIFEAVCAAGGVTGAADMLRMTQPGVSQAIRALERETGLVLFDRLGRRLHMTGAGRLYRAKIAPVLGLLDDLERNPAGLASGVPLRVGSCITVAEYWLPPVLTAFAGGREAPPLVVRVGPAAEMAALLDANDIDVALYEGPRPDGAYVDKPLSRYGLAWICAPRHPWAGRADVPPADLLRERLLLREPGSAVRDVLDSWLRLRQRLARPTMTSVDSRALVAATAAGCGVALLPDVMAREAEASKRVASFAVKGMRLQNENRMLLHADKHLTPSLRRFMACAMRAMRQSHGPTS